MLTESTLRNTVPLPDIVDAFVRRAEVSPDIISGDKWAYTVYLKTSTKSISTVTLAPPNQPETTSTELATLTFHDEAVAKHALAVVLHTSDLCRKSSGAQSHLPPKPTVSAPSLRETLDWLREKVDLATFNYVQSSNGTELSVSLHSQALSLNSCSGVFGSTVEGRSIGYRNDRPTKATRKSKVQLGTLVEFSVGAFVPTGQRANPPLSGYRVNLVSKSKNISVEIVMPNSASTAYETTEHLRLIFTDESLAHRVMEAFKHIAELCKRQQEPF